MPILVKTDDVRSGRKGQGSSQAVTVTVTVEDLQSVGNRARLGLLNGQLQCWRKHGIMEDLWLEGDFRVNV